ncbi:GNAT family N-acetyltransferase [Amycolatopsis sp. NBC_00355]|uniref:GNAT family N-acetyltransferase n=1 Tax=Amycolatopsis sp. NBC_00355 TaxID=2975957 RepID=UPI003FA418D8
MEWNIIEVPVTDPDAVAIMREYMDEVASRYYGRPATEAELESALADEPGTDLVAPTGAFLLGRRDGVLAGCVGTRVVEPGISELTKMYVKPAHRGSGAAPRLVAAAEDAARRLGARLMRLDTRDDLVEARALYARTGYTEVAPFNDDKYAEHWFEKALS